MTKSYNFSKAGSRNYRSWKKWEVGDVMTAKYIKPFQDQYDNTCHEVEVIETIFSETADNVKEGKIFGLNSCGGLNYKIDDAGVSKGSIVRVEYAGEEEMTDGKFKGKNFHNVELEYDNDAATGTEAESIKKVQDEMEEEEDYDL